MDQLKYINRFGRTALYKDVHYAAASASKLGQDELHKLFTFLFSNEDTKPLIKSYLDLPLESFEKKVSRKWATYEGKANSQLPKHYTERVFRRREANVNYPVDDLCFYHFKYGQSASKCYGPPCRESTSPLLVNKLSPKNPTYTNSGGEKKTLN